MSARIPTATYRIQFSPQFTFAQALEIVDYLDELGVSDCYASPLLAAAPGSTHGYDVIDHSRLNSELGSEDEFRIFAASLRTHGMGLIMDIVPNHMYVGGSHNRYWNDVLENGPSSPFAPYFDIDWSPPKSDLKDKVLVPMLFDQYGQVLENGDITVGYENESFMARYFETRLPLAPRTWLHILEPALSDLRQALGAENLHVLELESILTALTHLPPPTETDQVKVREQRREKEIIKRRLSLLLGACPRARDAVEYSLHGLNGRKGDAHSFDRLEALLTDQSYRPCSWRVASDEINYRRFFDVNELAAIRVEEPSVFDAVHEVPLRLVEQGFATGVRIDHIDGLLEPEKYLIALQRAFGAVLPKSSRSENGEPGSPNPCYVVVEKILAPKEQLPVDWPVHGTTGYEFANLLGGLFVDVPGIRALRKIYERFNARPERFLDILYESKKLVLRSAMSAELTVLARKLDRISEQHRTSRDFTLNSLQEALEEFIACFPVYRTYLRSEDTSVNSRDRNQIESAIREVKRRNPATNESIYNFLKSILVFDDPESLGAAERAERRDFVLRLQQLTGPVMAKGLEDTAFYRHLPLASINEVGGGVGRFGVTMEEFHAGNTERLQWIPHGLSATSTHDTKRSEDVRARLSVLSEIPELWEQAINRWRDLNHVHKARLEAEDVPDANDEYLFYQTLVGAWPLGRQAPDQPFVGRIQRYMNKALKEAKIHTSWINPNEAYDKAVGQFIATVLDQTKNNSFLVDLTIFLANVERAGLWNSLSQTILKIGAPGVPDFYQGTELWDFSLVDPDNRRPVDFGLRKNLLATLISEARADPASVAERLLQSSEDGRVKLFVTSRGLAFRRSFQGLFRMGGYSPLVAVGNRADNVVAFSRSNGDNVVLIATARFFIQLGAPSQLPIGAVWDKTALHVESYRPDRYRDVLTQRVLTVKAEAGRRELAMTDVFAYLPVAILEGLR